MRSVRGQTLRRLGLLIEASCMLGLLGVSRGRLPPQRFAGLTPGQYLAGGLVFGFALWFAGTMAIYWPKKSRGPE